MTSHSFTVSSDLPIPAEQFSRNLDMAGVNYELGPLVKMTAPEEWKGRAILEWPEGRLLFSSWILLLGVIPIDRHHFQLDAVLPGEGFVENSSSTTNRFWRHSRTIQSASAGCRVTDTVQYENRLPLLGALFKPVYRLVFSWRHHRLKSLYSKGRSTG